jgi:hypothetical protein
MLSQFGVEVTMDENNHSDIVQYVKLELPTYLDPLLSSIQNKIISRANGVFLWAVLVSKKMLKAVDQGKGEQQLHHFLESIPIELMTCSMTSSTRLSLRRRKGKSSFVWLSGYCVPCGL